VGVAVPQAPNTSPPRLIAMISSIDGLDPHILIPVQA
jgi:hypothetical protein